MQHDAILALYVLGKPGFIHESLLVLLQAASSVKVVGSSTDTIFSMDRIAAIHPGMVIADCTAPSEQCAENIRLLKQKCPEIKFLAIIEAYQKKAAADWVGVDGLIIKGFTAQELYETIAAMAAGKIIGRSSRLLSGVE